MTALGATLAVLVVLCVEHEVVYVSESQAGPAGAVSSGDGGDSRPSKNNRQGGDEPPEAAESTDSAGDGGSSEANRTNRPESLDPADLVGATGLRPLSVEAGRSLREEAVHEPDEGPQAKPWYSVVNAWRDWYNDYRSMHIEYEKDGEIGRSRLENSYQPRYGKRYYAKLKDLERGIEREYQSLTTVMLTFSASNLNRDEQHRCPADHMRDIAEGWRTARKQLHQVLSGRDWEYARVWEPHESGYGHLHVAVFVEAEDLDGEMFRPVLDSYVHNTSPAGSEAHTVGNAVSVNNCVENLGTYISEYIGVFGEDPLDRSMKEQMFYAVTWATQTRRVDFSNGAQKLMKREKFRRDTGLEPERIESDVVSDWDQSGGSDEENLAGVEIDPERETVQRASESAGWTASSICTVRGDEPNYSDPTSGGVSGIEIVGREGVDLPPEVD